MVIGNGLVAKAFKTYESSDEFLIFASGVSNSKSSLPEDYQKEKDLFIKTVAENPEKIFVYFSTTSVYDPDLFPTSYVKHKLEMEELVKTRIRNYYIFRLSNLAGNSINRHTILNFFNYQITHDLPFQCWNNAERNIIDIADVFRIVSHLIQNKIFTNDTTNIANRKNYKVPYIINCLEFFHQKKAKIQTQEKGTSFIIDTSNILPIVEKLNIRFGKNYLPVLINKYFSENDLQTS